MWRDLIEPLAASYRVICPDLRGLGWSDAPRRGYTRGDMSRDLIGLLDALRLPTTRIVAHDWGLIPAYWASLFWSWRVEQLVALSGPHIWAASGTPVRAYLRLWHFLVLTLPPSALAVRLVAPRALRSWRYLGSFSDQEVEAYLERIMRRSSAAATARRYRRILGDFLFYARHARDLGLPVPTLNLVGEHDRQANSSPPNAYMETNAVDFHYEMVPDAGHFLAEERPEFVANRILSFFSE